MRALLLTICMFLQSKCDKFCLLSHDFGFFYLRFSRWKKGFSNCFVSATFALAATASPPVRNLAFCIYLMLVMFFSNVKSSFFSTYRKRLRNLNVPLVNENCRVDDCDVMNGKRSVRSDAHWNFITGATKRYARRVGAGSCISKSSLCIMLAREC